MIGMFWLCALEMMSSAALVSRAAKQIAAGFLFSAFLSCSTCWATADSLSGPTKMCIRDRFKSIGTQKLIAVIALVAIYLFFAIASKDFRSWSTLVSIFDMSYYIGFMAIGVTFVIITGGIDLSIGTVCICSGLIGGQLYKMGVPIALCLIITILIGIVFGLLIGLMVSIMKLPAFIATLGTMMVTRGLGSIVTGTQSITYPCLLYTS